MKYHLFTVGEKDYKLRLSAQGIIDTEKRLGKSIIDVMVQTEKGKLPELNELLIILYGSLQKYHSVKMNEVCDLYDEYVDNGGDLMGLIETITEVLKVSGFFRETKTETGEIVNE